jgi:GDPmannose 4,6-dehydratase
MKALVIGCRGQDGSYLSDFLRSKQYEVIGVGRHTLHRYPPGSIEPFVSTANSLSSLLAEERADEAYYLAAFHSSAEDTPIKEVDLVYKSFETNTLAVADILASLIEHSPATRLFYAASSHVFGEPGSEIQDESTPLNPTNIYGISKASAIHLCHYFRRNLGVYVSVGILYNHESPRRSSRFLSKKVVEGGVDIKRGLREHLVLGDLDHRVDWGFAPDYVSAMWAILQLDDPDDFVVATGTLHSVRDLVSRTFETLGLEWTKYIAQRPALITKRSVPLCGDSSKLNRLTQWKPSISFDQMIRIMVAEESRAHNGS